MKEEDKSRLLVDAFAYLDEDMLKEVNELRSGMVEEKRRFCRWRRWAAWAASVCVLLFGTWIWQNRLLNENISKETVEEVAEEDSGESCKKEETVQKDGSEIGKKEEIATGANADANQESAKAEQEADNQEICAILKTEQQKNDAAIEDALLLSKEHKIAAAEFLDAVAEGSCFSLEDAQNLRLEDAVLCHLYFFKENGDAVHLLLLGDGKVALSDSENVYIQMDKASYQKFVNILQEMIP